MLFRSWVPPRGDGIRVDHGISAGMRVTPHYDPMIAKVVASGPDRDTARRRLVRALEDTLLMGVTHNGWFLSRVLGHETFAAGDATTAFLETEFSDDPSLQPLAATSLELAVAALVLYRSGINPANADRGGWSNSLPSACPMLLNDGLKPAWVRLMDQGGELRVHVGEQEHNLAVEHFADGELVLSADSVRRRCHYRLVDRTLFCRLSGRTLTLRDDTHAPARKDSDQGTGEIRATMDGAVVEISVTEGETVTRGQTLAVLEAMKMEHPLKADCDGTVSELRVEAGSQVRNRQLLMSITPSELANGERE